MKSMIPKYSAKINTVMMTTVVVARTSSASVPSPCASPCALRYRKTELSPARISTARQSCQLQLNLPFSSSRLTSLLLALTFSPKTLAGAEGFEPPSSVLETDSLTVELTPLYSLSDFVTESLNDCQTSRHEIFNRPIGNHAIAQSISLLYAACAYGNGGRTS